MSELLEVTGIDVFYGDFQALFGVSLTVAAGQAVALVGANGAGKTTLLRAIAGGEAVTSGSVRLGGADLTAAPPHRIITSSNSTPSIPNWTSKSHRKVRKTPTRTPRPSAPKSCKPWPATSEAKPPT